MSSPEFPPPPELLLACLCAAWCTTCEAYQAPFLQLQSEFPTVRVVWIDIEDEADLIDPIEVENFPTLLLATPTAVGFFGTMTPHIDTLRRMVRSQLEPNVQHLAPERLRDALGQRVWQRFVEQSGA